MRIDLFKAAFALLVPVLALGFPAPALSDEPAAVAAITKPERAKATIADMAWLEGEWGGVGIGGNPAGEIFTFAGNDRMVGHFWQLDETGGIDFYELITIVPDGDSLVMRLKHFTDDLTGWEEKPGSSALEFPLVERSNTLWVFGPVRFVLVSPDRLDITVTVRMDDGSLTDFQFSYSRQSPR